MASASPTNNVIAALGRDPPKSRDSALPIRGLQSRPACSSSQPTRSPSLQIIAEDHAALHHKLHSFHLGDVGERITRNCNEVGELPLFNTADLVPQVIVEALGCIARGHPQRLRRRHSPFYEIGK